MGDRGRPHPARRIRRASPGRSCSGSTSRSCVLFPYLLYRFAVAFEPATPAARAVRRHAQRHARHCDASCSRPCPPRARRGRGGSSPTPSRSSSTGRCCSSSSPSGSGVPGGDEASVARKRMRMLAFASSALTAALVFSLAAGDEGSVGALLVGAARNVERRRVPARLRAAGEPAPALAAAGAEPHAGRDRRADVGDERGRRGGARAAADGEHGRRARDRRSRRRTARGSARTARSTRPAGDVAHVGVSVRATGRADEHLRAVLRRRGAEAAAPRSAR